MSWWNAPVPLWQVLILVMAYVIYKELVKLLFKSAVKRIWPKPELARERRVDDGDQVRDNITLT